MLVLILLFIGSAIAQMNSPSLNPLSEDSNGNGMPDIVELQIGKFSFPSITLGVSIATALTVIITVIYFVESKKCDDIDHRVNLDLPVKIFKSKYRRWLGVRVLVFTVLLVFLLVIPVHAENKPILSEDPDGDGLPTVVEIQLGSDPNNPYDYVCVESIGFIVNTTGGVVYVNWGGSL